MENNEKKKSKPAAALQGRTIGLWLDGYDDIFSDFDPRSFASRNFSDDFLVELRKLYSEDHTGVAGIQLLLPALKRNAEAEEIIIKRMHAYFRQKQKEEADRHRRLRRNGILMALAGSLVLFGAGLAAMPDSKSLLRNLLLVFFEPVGWFLCWTGLDTMVLTGRRKRAQLDFYSRMVKCRIEFLPIED